LGKAITTPTGSFGSSRGQSLFPNLVASRRALREALAAVIYSPPANGAKLWHAKML